MNNKLPDFVLADLYRNNIVSIKDGKTQLNENKKDKDVLENSSAVAEKKWFLGDNKKRILIIIADENAAIVGDENLTFLSKILAAFNCTLADVVITNYAANAKTFSFLKRNFHPQNVFLFGVTTKQVQLSFLIPNYQVQAYDNCLFVCAPALSELNGDSQEAKIEKSKLWISLKKVFEK